MSMPNSRQSEKVVHLSFSVADLLLLKRKTAAFLCNFAIYGVEPKNSQLPHHTSHMLWCHGYPLRTALLASALQFHISKKILLA